MELKSPWKHLPLAYIFHSPLKPMTGPLPFVELWTYQEQTSVATVYWDHPSAAENTTMHSVNIEGSGVTCSNQLTKGISIKTEWKGHFKILCNSLTGHSSVKGQRQQREATSFCLCLILKFDKIPSDNNLKTKF